MNLSLLQALTALFILLKFILLKFLQLQKITYFRCKNEYVSSDFIELARAKDSNPIRGPSGQFHF